ncbi:hypothetical protein [Roseivirga misakiensis]|uniref:Lipoprotein n=1 Tax=Roseivirga misakiensis TaxID=1563681 RepID=A0A1E5T6Z2_9BACT|nr:hypothetical protein [Roseivirga misakiensis]OEK07116.1 hypothetical protein BFP71_05515 [Roseivirga misakiensis]
MHVKSFLTVCLISLFLSCNPDKRTVVDQASVTFATDDASELFFKNVRQLYYNTEVMEEAKLNIFRLKKRDLSNDRPIINLAIVNNWRFDEAYLLLEPNDLIGQADTITIKWSNADGNNGEVLYEKGNKNKQAEFADSIYAHIQKGSTFSIKIEDDWVAFLDTEKSREAFRITVFDYYKLVKRI